MAFSEYLKATANMTYYSLPTLAEKAGLAGGLCYVINRLTSRYNLPTPINVAAFTAAANVVFTAHKNFITQTKTEDNELYKYTLITLGFYGIHTCISKETSLQSFMKLSAIAIGVERLFESEFFSKNFNVHFDKLVMACNYKSEREFSYPDRSLDTVVLYSLRHMYTQLPERIVSTVLARTLCTYIPSLGINAKDAMMVSVAAAALNVAKEVLGNCCKTMGLRENYINEGLAIAGLTYIAKQIAYLNLPTYKTLGKAYGVAMTTFIVSSKIRRFLAPLR